MKAYTDNQLKHITNDGEYKMLSFDEDCRPSHTRVFTKSLKCAIEYRIGTIKASFYTRTVPKKIDHKDAYELLQSLFYMKGISKTDLEVMMFEIDASIVVNG